MFKATILAVVSRHWRNPGRRRFGMTILSFWVVTLSPSSALKSGGTSNRTSPKKSVAKKLSTVPTLITTLFLHKPARFFCPTASLPVVNMLTA